MGEATKATERSRIRMGELTEEEKYRRMREQNNRASQACRAKRKRKLVEEEEELATLQQKNIQLQAVLKEMEKEVKAKHIIEVTRSFSITYSVLKYVFILGSNVWLFQVASYKKRILEQVSGVRN